MSFIVLSLTSLLLVHFLYDKLESTIASQQLSMTIISYFKARTPYL